MRHVIIYVSFLGSFGEMCNCIHGAMNEKERDKGMHNFVATLS